MLACGAIFRFSHAHWESEFYDLIQGMSSPSLSRNHLSECNAMAVGQWHYLLPQGMVWYDSRYGKMRDRYRHARENRTE